MSKNFLIECSVGLLTLSLLFVFGYEITKADVTAPVSPLVAGGVGPNADGSCPSGYTPGAECGDWCIGWCYPGGSQNASTYKKPPKELKPGDPNYRDTTTPPLPPEDWHYAPNAAPDRHQNGDGSYSGKVGFQFGFSASRNF